MQRLFSRAYPEHHEAIFALKIIEIDQVVRGVYFPFRRFPITPVGRTCGGLVRYLLFLALKRMDVAKLV
jgi:hypothetical protein